MDHPFDLFAKDALELLLEDAGEVRRQLEVTTPAQYVDTVFVPSRRGLARLRRRGLLGRMARRTSAWECFHDAPSVPRLRDVARKHLAWHHQRAARPRGKRTPREPPLPALWVVCAARPTRALRLLKASRAHAWPRGVYDVARGLVGMRVVVVGELPVTPATLPLRLMGRDRVLEAALEELAALPPGAWARRLASAVVEFMNRRNAKEHGVSERTERIKKRAEELFNAAHARGVREGIERGIERGIEQGIERGIEQGIALIAEHRLGRPLLARERAALRRRLDALGAKRATTAIADLDAAALAAWLRPAPKKRAAS
ncbi:MAG: hypothetical protein U0324_46515 [Polyangiales bacterium]